MSILRPLQQLGSALSPSNAMRRVSGSQGKNVTEDQNLYFKESDMQRILGAQSMGDIKSILDTEIQQYTGSQLSAMGERAMMSDEGNRILNEVLPLLESRRAEFRRRRDTPGVASQTKSTAPMGGGSVSPSGVSIL